MCKYLQFNEWAYNYYLERNSNCLSGTLAIEVTEIERYLKGNNCDLRFKEINGKDWSSLLDKINDIPKYFGLIALQCYAASLMEKDDGNNIGVNDYQKRLIEVCGINNQQNLQNKFSSLHINMSIQEKIWICAQEFFVTKNVKINIPIRKRFKGKYIQYPLSQVILNQEDLKEYVSFFIEIEKLFDEISFDVFQKYYKNYKNRFQFNRRNNLKEDRQEYENNIKLKQIFDFYCSQNWINIAESLVTNKIKIEEPKYFLAYSELAETKIQLYKEPHECADFSDVNLIFKKSRIKGILFFKKSDDYEKEFDLVSYLENETEYILVAHNDSNPNDLKILKECFECISFDNEKFEFFKGKIDVNRLPSELVELIIEPYPLKLAGVKISRKKQYLINFPPKIINDKNISYRIYPEYNIENVKVGKYQIRVPSYSNLNFEIIENPKLKGIVHPKELGLKISNLNIVERDYNVQGLYYSENQELKEKSLNINNWIDLQNGNLNSKQKMQTNNIILKALTQYKNGR